SLSAVVDPVTLQLQPHADAWRNVHNFSDEQLAALVRNDKIDILVDLAMHTHGARRLLFARKPAPAQTTHLTYPGTTGLSTIDYRLTDPHLDPVVSGQPSVVSAEASSSSSDHWPLTTDNSSEQPLHLPETYWCYTAPLEAPPPSDLPALKNNFITFGCLN